MSRNNKKDNGFRFNSVLDLPEHLRNRKTADGKTVAEALKESTANQLRGLDKKVKPVYRTEPAREIAEKSFIVVPGKPVPKPRQTQADKWYHERKSVNNYRAWCWRVESCRPKDLTDQPMAIFVVAYIPMPKSWDASLHDEKWGQQFFHRQKPDADNILKAVCDAFWKEDDSMIPFKVVAKFWCRPSEERTEITVYNSLDIIVDLILTKICK